MKLGTVGVVIAGAVMLGSAPARADDNSSLVNWMAGPMIGIRLGRADAANRLVIGFEGGGGIGPERFNLGLEHRAGKELYYAEIDPWVLVGASLGYGIDSDGVPQPVLGLWEGVPLDRSEYCTGWHREASISFGYRYTGVHEIYVGAKAGEMNGDFCN